MKNTQKKELAVCGFEAVKALAKAVTTGKAAPKKGSNAERVAKARQAING